MSPERVETTGERSKRKKKKKLGSENKIRIV